MNTREKVLSEALKCVNGEREKQYGSPEDNFRRIADLWSTYLTNLFEDEKIVVDIDPIDVAKMMILFKIARSNGDKDKLDNYVDMIGYAACGAEIFEGQDRNGIPQKRIEVFPCDHIKVAEECRNCDYAEKCIGTGVCLKEKEKEHLKKVDKNCDDCRHKDVLYFDHPCDECVANSNGGTDFEPKEEKCNRNDCGQFDACMTAYQHYIYNKTKEASEAIDKCLLDQKDPYSYARNKLYNYVSIKAREEHVPFYDLKSINARFPKGLSDYLDRTATDCVENGKRFLECYREIDELFEKNSGTVCNEESTMRRVNNIVLDIDNVIQASKNLKGYKFDHIDRNPSSNELVIHWRKEDSK